MVTELVDDGDDEGSAFHRAPARSAGAMAAWEQAAEADAASARGSACGPVAELNLVLAGMREVARSGWHAMPGRSAHEALRSEEHTSELQSRGQLVCRLLLEKKNTTHCGQAG